MGRQRALKSVSHSHIICTMHVMFLLILFALLPLLGTCAEVDGQMVNGISSNDYVSNHDHNSTTHLMEDESEVGLELKISLTLNKCATSKLKNVISTQLPTFFLLTSHEYVYILGNHSVGNNPPACSNGETSEIITASPSEFDRIHETEGPQTIRKVIALLSNGYLSVANSSDGSIIYYSPNECCLQDIIGPGENAVAKLRICIPSKSRPILNKCCQVGAILDSDQGICVDSKEYKWDPGYVDPNTAEHLPIESVNPVYRSIKLGCDEDHREDWIENECHDEFYPATNGKTAFIGAHRYRWEYAEHLPNSKYCYDKISMDNGLKNLLIMCSENGTESKKEETHGVSHVYMVCMYIGAFFHLITSLFYLITWTKQNIHGKTLCSCTLALFFMKVFLGTAHLLGILGNTNKKGFCFFNSVAAQYFMIASFTWLLVVNIDLWWTFSAIRPGGGNGLKRFILYSLGGWGFPLFVTGISLTLNSIYTCRISRVPTPDYGEHICFVAPWAQGYYIYYILSILIAIAFLFAVLTLIGLYSFKKGTNNLRSNKRAEDKQTVLLFLKLSVVMGLSWIFEVISWAVTKEDKENHIVWIIFDLYNALSAILIFIIFVCKRSTLNLLEQTHPMFKVFTSAISKFTSSFIGEASSTATASTGAGAPSGPPKKKSYDTVTFTKDKNDEGQVNGGFETNS
ncbi:unnamed protein product [Orchesella dallaii]|uniref:G-protein coupled receptors family 2 profile 2 domain-containing protein n=1 Tax=Orchesella dallaii TaxID=48710 RepID=A0ABP1Q6E6_9HEXA